MVQYKKIQCNIMALNVGGGELKVWSFCLQLKFNCYQLKIDYLQFYVSFMITAKENR